MKARTLLGLVAILIALAVVVAVVVHKKKPGEREKKLGEPLFKELDVNNIALITIVGPKDKGVELKKGEKFWEVVQKYGYPAEFDKIRSLVRKISELKIGRAFKATPEIAARLKLVSPLEKKTDDKEQGTLISLKDADGNELAGIIIGKRHSTGEAQAGSASQYVRLTKGEMVYLVDKTFPFIETTPKGWLDKELIKVQPENIRKISAVRGNGKVLYAFERQEKGKKLEPIGTLIGKRLNKSKLNRLERGIAFLTLLDVVDPKTDPKTLGIDESTYVAYELFDGIRYKIFTGKSRRNGHDEIHLKISVDYITLPNKSETDSQMDKSKESKREVKEDLDELKLKAEQLSQRLSPWVFVVSKWNGESFVTDPQELVEKEGEGKEAPSKSERSGKKS